MLALLRKHEQSVDRLEKGPVPLGELKRGRRSKLVDRSVGHANGSKDLLSRKWVNAGSRAQARLRQVTQGIDEGTRRLDGGADASRRLPETGRPGIVESPSDPCTNGVQARAGRGGTPGIKSSWPGRSHGSVSAVAKCT